MNSSPPEDPWLLEWQLYQRLAHPGLPEPLNEGSLLLTVSARAAPANPLVGALWRSIEQPWLPDRDTSRALASSPGDRSHEGQQPVDAPRVGTVLQLAPPLAAPELTETLVLVTAASDSWLELAAFSPLDRPASSDELLTGIDEEGLRVLSVWNICRVTKGLLASAWRLNLDAATLAAEARQLRSATRPARGASVIPSSLAGRTGPPVSAPDDPRWDYFDAMSALILPLQNLDDQLRRATAQ